MLFLSYLISSNKNLFLNPTTIVNLSILEGLQHKQVHRDFGKYKIWFDCQLLLPGKGKKVFKNPSEVIVANSSESFFGTKEISSTISVNSTILVEHFQIDWLSYFSSLII